MGLLRAKERRVSGRASFHGLRASSSGRKLDAKQQHAWNLKFIGVSVLVLAAFVAAVGILRVENMHLRTLAPRQAFAAAARAAQPAAAQQRQTHQNHQTQQAAAAVQEPAAAAAPIPDELPAAPQRSSHYQTQAQDQHQADQAPSSGSSSSNANQAEETLSQQQQQQQQQVPEQQQQQQPFEDEFEALAAAAAAAAVAAAAAAAAAQPHPSASMPKNRLLLATHSRLMWYFPDTDECLVLHEGEGVHYGMFPGAGATPTSVWTAIRPHNWRPATNKEYLVELDMASGAELRRVPIPSRFTHDVVRSDEGVFVCDTGNGRVLQLSFPDMTPVRSMDLFSLKDHPNTLAPLGDDNFLVVLHNLGKSDIVRVNVSSFHTIPDPEAWLAAQALNLPETSQVPSPAEPQEETLNPAAAKPRDPEGIVGRVQRVGHKAHGLVPWQGAYIILDSDSGALAALDLTGAAAGQGFKLHRLWKAPEDGVFLKGLAVVDDIAYFGISPWAPRSARDDPQSNNELAAFDLISGRLLWRRQIPTAGLLNVIGAPHLTVGSTYLPSYTGRPETDSVRSHHTSPEVAAAMNSLNELGYPPKIGGYWSSGLPFLDANIKGTKRPWEAGLQLPLLMLNISKMQAAIAALPREAWTYDYQAKYSAVMAGREGNQNAFKPGVEGIVLLFSANDGSGPVYKFPAYDYFKDAIEPLLEEIVGKRDMQHIIRLQLALMKPGVSDIKIHVDSGGYAIRGHRLHIPIFTHPEVSFDVCPHRYVPDPGHTPSGDEPQRMLDIQECFKVPTVDGFAFELNNRAAHKVSNLSPVERVHVVFDLCEEPHPRVDVPPGTVCDYDVAQGLLCTYPDGLTPAVLAPAAYLDPAAAAAESGYIPAAYLDSAAAAAESGYIPAAYLDPAAAAAESGYTPPEQMAQLEHQMAQDTGSGYTPADDELAAAAAAGDADSFAESPAGEGVEEDVRAPVPDPAGSQPVNYELLAHTGVAADEFHQEHPGSRSSDGLVGTIRNGHSSVWVTETMRGAGGSIAVA